ncbi:SusD/RagB family nutrient-binding outer membrane lipoprotein [Zobellia russellii]|uniref:SusD/RagB family nutrient-binding outer membrane lipoprotein n=1 Tax=Zobellia russellii TaxID=248907 RepID=UPI001BFFD180|nr:SusD/RagB family nutrient-binding outer membrane lipoprotein [Zobellia russellii]MBT9187597.1 SusD/RagB family nutrient-binding outer membrane lipoprotein [Zobellia russellii]
MYKKLINTVLIFTILLTGCTKDFEEINTDPNRPEEITPGVLLGQLQYRMVNSAIQSSRSFTHELMQVDVPRESTGGGGQHRYVINPGEGVWTSFYSYLTDIKDLQTISEELNEDNYRGIALVYKSWAFSILTDLYGDIPYFEATSAGDGVFQPKFDKQKDIYVQILNDLEIANSLFDDSKALTYGGDLVYDANELSGDSNPGITKWKKFANSLRLRLLLRISKRDGEIDVTSQINTILSDPETYPVFTSIDDNAIFNYTGSFPYFNPYYNARTVDWSENVYFTKFFIDGLNDSEDPRRNVWALTVEQDGQNIYKGAESGYPVTTQHVVGQNSSYSDNLKTFPQLGIMMTYAEVEFIKAELALKNYPTGQQPKDHYASGIMASMAQWGAPMPNDFLERENIKYDTSATTEGQMTQIMLQKYYAYFFVDYQSWFEKRRTGYPELPRGEGIPLENNFPSRIPYPTYLQSLNPNNLEAAVNNMGGDNSDIKVWWDK